MIDAWVEISLFPSKFGFLPMMPSIQMHPADPKYLNRPSNLIDDCRGQLASDKSAA
jgi:hypothetical protein